MNGLLVSGVLRRERSHLLYDLIRVNAFDCRCKAAILGMLQTCSPGLAVVNVDNGVGAGAMVGLIANRAAAGRRWEQRSG